MNIQELANLAAKTEDQTETTAGGSYEYTPPEAGKTIGRFIEYIELGKHGQKPYQGKPKPDAEKVRITFELLHPKKNIKEVELEGGEKKKVSEIISFEIAKGFNEKSGFKKLFNKMRYGRDSITHMAQMLGHPFLIEIIHNTVGEGTEKRTYANIKDAEGTYLIYAPVIEDPMSGEKKDLPVPESLRPMKIFLWDHANKETWDSLFIDGTVEIKNGDKTEQVSKNRIQEKILSAKNYKGSPLEQLLAGVDKLPVKEESKQEVKSDDPDTNALAELGLL